MIFLAKWLKLAALTRYMMQSRPSEALVGVTAKAPSIC